MAVINVGDSNRKKLARKIVGHGQKWWIKYLLVPTLIIGPLSLINFVLIKHDIGAKILAFLPQGVADYITHSAVGILAALWVIGTLFKALWGALESYSQPERSLKLEDLIAILSAVQIAVDGKSVRFHDTVKTLRKNPTADPKNVFLAITKPDQQLALITKAVHTVFSTIYPDANFRIGLMKIVQKQPDEWTCFEPSTSPPMTEAKDLALPTTTVMACIKAKRIAIVEDIQKEIKKKPNNNCQFEKFNFQEHQNGSQLCCPVLHPVTREIEYVISVQSDKVKTFMKSHHALYGWILEHFTLRISLEHSLLILKEKTND